MRTSETKSSRIWASTVVSCSSSSIRGIESPPVTPSQDPGRRPPVPSPGSASQKNRDRAAFVIRGHDVGAAVSVVVGGQNPPGSPAVIGNGRDARGGEAVGSSEGDRQIVAAGVDGYRIGEAIAVHVSRRDVARSSAGRDLWAETEVAAAVSEKERQAVSGRIRDLPRVVGDHEVRFAVLVQETA